MDSTQTLGEIGEFGLLHRLSVSWSDQVIIGPGDDAAEIANRESSFLVCTDVLVEGRHFRRDWSSAYEVGRKAAAVSLSDISAMGGTGTALTIALCAPPTLEVQWAERLYEGLSAEADLVGAAIAGGDVSAADQIIISVTATGTAERAVRRNGAQVGDIVAVTGRLGWAKAGLIALSRGFGSPRAAANAHRAPQPPYRAGPQAARWGATSMIDVSDGLIGDLMHISRASKVGFQLHSQAFDLSGPVETVAQAFGLNPLDLVLSGGEDYALAATFAPNTPLEAPWKEIGRVVAGNEVLIDGKPYTGPASHQHFE